MNCNILHYKKSKFAINQFIERSRNRKRKVLEWYYRRAKIETNSNDLANRYPHQNTFKPRQKSMLTTK